MEQKNTQCIKKLLIAGLITLSLPLHSMDKIPAFLSIHWKEGAGVGAAAVGMIGSYYYGRSLGAQQCEKKAQLSVPETDAKITTTLMSMDVMLQSMLDASDLETYARGVYGVQPIGTLQKDVNIMAQCHAAMLSSLTSEQHREQHKKVLDLLSKVRTRIGGLNPAVIAQEARDVDALETDKKLNLEKIAHQKNLHKQSLVDFAKTHKLVQDEQKAKIVAHEAAKKAYEVIQKQEALSDAILKDHAAIVQVCTVLPAKLEEVGLNQGLAVSGAINDLKKEINQKLDNLNSRIDSASVQTEKTITDKICEVAKGQTQVFTTQMNTVEKKLGSTVETKLGNKISGVEKSLTAKSVELGEKISGLTNQVTKQGADVVSTKDALHEVKKMVQEQHLKYNATITLSEAKQDNTPSDNKTF